jgi:hypothetical protein
VAGTWVPAIGPSTVWNTASSARSFPADQVIATVSPCRAAKSCSTSGSTPGGAPGRSADNLPLGMPVTRHGTVGSSANDDHATVSTSDTSVTGPVCITTS